MRTIPIKIFGVALLVLLLLGSLSLFIVSDIRSSHQHNKDRVIIRVLLTYHRDVLHHKLNPDLLYEDGVRWVDDPKYNAVEYP